MAPAGTASRNATAKSSSEPTVASFAKRLPKIKKSGDAVVDAKSDIDYYASQQIISLLQGHPEAALETPGGLQRLIASKKRKADALEDPEPKFAENDCASVGKLPDGWVSGFLQALCNGRLDDDLFSKILRRDPQSMGRLRKFALQMSDATALPPAMSVKKVAARVLHDRHTVLGAPLSHDWVTKSVSLAGDINWKIGGRCWVFSVATCSRNGAGAIFV